MYATLETYDLHDPQCPQYHTKENYEGPPVRPSRKPKLIVVDTPQDRRKRRGGGGIDHCKPYDPLLPYRYMFDPHYNKYPYGPEYNLVDGEDYGKRYLNVPAYSYPDYDSTTRVLYCDAPPKIWEFGDPSY